MVKLDVVIKIKFTNIQSKYLRTHLEPDIPDIDLPSSEVTVPSTGNTEHFTSETTSMEPSTNADPASPDPDTDAAVVNPNTSQVYPKRNHAPVVRFEPTWT